MFFNWVAFFYIAATAKYRKWYYYGLVYTIPFLLVILVPYNGLIYDISIEILITGWITSIFHAFLLRKEYLIRLETLKKIQPDIDAKLKKKIEKEYGINKPKTIHKKPKTSPEKTTNFNKNVNEENVENYQQKQPSSGIDVNNASEETLSELPGVSLILAKNAVQLRDSGVYFESAEDFGEALGLKPHIIARIKPLIVVVPHRKAPMHKGRRIDI